MTSGILLCLSWRKETGENREIIQLALKNLTFSQKRSSPSGERPPDGENRKATLLEGRILTRAHC